MHIPPSALLAQDKVHLLDNETGQVTEVHATDAKQAITNDPERYSLVIDNSAVTEQRAIDARFEISADGIRSQKRDVIDRGL
jgi:hypothetical protein